MDATLHLHQGLVATLLVKLGDGWKLKWINKS